MNTYSITLPWPPSNNRYYRHNRGRTHISAEGQAYRDNVARIIKGSMLDIGLAMPVKIRIECHMPDDGTVLPIAATFAGAPSLTVDAV
ncbi:endodeoxyribonuclease RusA family protein, partial [Escherichia coli 97.1742]